jgi:cytochrome c5
MRRLNVFILAALLSAALAGLAQQNSGQNQPAEPAPAPIRPEAAAKKNPVKPTPQGLSEARKRHGYHCAMCHRKEGDGHFQIH